MQSFSGSTVQLAHGDSKLTAALVEEEGVNYLCMC